MDSQKKKDQGKAKKSDKWHFIAFEYMETFVFTAITVILVLTFAVRICEVGGPSMEKTLIDKERLLVSDLFYSPKAGDVIVFHETDERPRGFNKPIVKRVIATEGEFVQINYNEGKVYVSDDAVFTEDELLDESAYVYLDNGKWDEAGFKPTEVFEVPDGQLFVMGDNRNNSADSRSDTPGMGVGFVEEERVLGKVLLRIYPFSKIGFVK